MRAWIIGALVVVCMAGCSATPPVVTITHPSDGELVPEDGRLLVEAQISGDGLLPRAGVFVILNERGATGPDAEAWTTIESDGSMNKRVEVPLLPGAHTYPIEVRATSRSLLGATATGVGRVVVRAEPEVYERRKHEARLAQLEDPVRAKLDAARKLLGAGRAEEAWNMALEAFTDATQVRGVMTASTTDKSVIEKAEKFADEIAASVESFRGPLIESLAKRAMGQVGRSPDEAEKTLERAIAISDGKSSAGIVEAQLEVVRGYVKADKASEAIRVLERVRSTGLGDAATTAVTKARAEVYEAVVRAIRSRVASAAVEEAARLANLVERVMPDRTNELTPVRAEFASKAHEVAVDLLKKAQALPESEYYDVEALVGRALALEPGNGDAKKLLEVVGVAKGKWAPTYVKDAHAQREGDGFIVYFTIANSKGEMVRCPGKARFRVIVTEFGRVPAQDLGARETTVAARDFEVREVGLNGAGGKKLMYVFPRVSDKEFHLDSDQNRSTLRFRMEHGSQLQAKLTFEPTGGGSLQGSTEIPPP